METAIVFGVGAEAGIGGAACRRFAREGLHVVAVGRSTERIEGIAASVRAAGGAATAVAADATREADVVRVFDAAARAGDPALVVYNVGNMFARPLLEMDEKFFETAWRVCCLGGFHVGREAARRMTSPDPDGPRRSLIFTGATASVRARPPFLAFASAKAALRALAHGMAREFGPQGLHVAHVVVDGGIAGEQLLSRIPDLARRAGPHGLLDPEAIVEAYWQLHAQPRSAWTLELDVRPWKETF
jgi:NAD(P)-dependent dehydrogenase (short-subunit alcohol dehydrogenase family)